MNRFLVALVIAPLVLVSACSSSDDAGHNDADIAFAQQMVPHHEQAIEMTRLVPAADASPEVVELAAQIQKAQQPEIDTMRGWLDDWDATEDGGHDMSGTHDMKGMDGMMSDADMDRLGTLTGDAFDQAWLTMMIAHHEGAVAMARDELDEGDAPEAKRLARDIIATQQREIATMTGLLR